MPKALITGITGQDGSYLAEILLDNGFEVHGLVRRSATKNTSRIDHLLDKITLHYGDLSDAGSIIQIVDKVEPDQIYNLAAQSHVRISFDVPEFTADITGLGALRILEAIKLCSPDIKYYQASSSEMFGNAPALQNEDTPFNPQSPYGIAKVFAHNITKLYRKAYGIYAVNGILFNHESPRRGENFVTRKITTGIAEIVVGKKDKIVLGNLEARRDWGYAKEYMEVAYLMMNQKEPDDYVIGTGESHSVKDFLELAFKIAGLGDYDQYVDFDHKFFRPTEVNCLIADSSKARSLLGWKPQYNFEKLVKMMVQEDIKKQGGEK